MMPEAIVDAIEPAAKDAVGDGLSDKALALASIAISLKRIADLAEERERGRVEISVKPPPFAPDPFPDGVDPGCPGGGPHVDGKPCVNCWLPF